MTEEPAEKRTNYLITDERRASVEKALFGDMADASLEDRLERVCEALFWNEVQNLGVRHKPAEQGTIDFMIAEGRAGHTRLESRQVLEVIRTDIRGKLYEDMAVPEPDTDEYLIPPPSKPLD